MDVEKKVYKKENEESKEKPLELLQVPAAGQGAMTRSTLE